MLSLAPTGIPGERVRGWGGRCLTRGLGLALMGAALLTTACAVGPRFALGDARVAPPTTRAADVTPGTTVIWGGVIVATTNRADGTQLEILSYPLGSWQRPDRSARAQGRFLVRQAGYLEPRTYASGRRVTVRGQVVEITRGRIGEATYRYPVVKPDPEGVYLWPESSGGEPQFRFGFGLQFSN